MGINTFDSRFFWFQSMQNEIENSDKTILFLLRITSKYRIINTTFDTFEL